MSQPGRNLLGFELLPQLNRLGPSVDKRRGTEDRALKTLLDNPIILDVEIGKEPDHQYRQGYKQQQRRADYRVTRHQPPAMVGVPLPPPNPDFYGHKCERSLYCSDEGMRLRVSRNWGRTLHQDDSSGRQFDRWRLPHSKSPWLSALNRYPYSR